MPAPAFSPSPALPPPDFLCNHLGNKAWIDGLVWSAQAAWARWVAARRCAPRVPAPRAAAPVAASSLRSQPPALRPLRRSAPNQTWAGGTFRRQGPLSFVRVRQAGHMVPLDQVGGLHTARLESRGVGGGRGCTELGAGKREGE